jgi:predicted dehydrogenase
VASNYRFRPVFRAVKELLAAWTIGRTLSVEFHWYLDVLHGADYFRRWHAYRENSGTLFVHTSTHHFDLINWILDDAPVEVSAYGALRHYGRNGSFRGATCRECDYADMCRFFLDIRRDESLTALYAECESEDRYLRDACVFREDLDIYDVMTAQVRYAGGSLMTYSLNTVVPFEGFHLAFNGAAGRLEVRGHERQPWEMPAHDEIHLTRTFGQRETIVVPHGQGSQFGSDLLLRRMLFDPSSHDEGRQVAGSRDGASALLTGVAAAKSAREGRRVTLAELGDASV